MDCEIFLDALYDICKYILKVNFLGFNLQQNLEHFKSKFCVLMNEGRGWLKRFSDVKKIDCEIFLDVLIYVYFKSKYFGFDLQKQQKLVERSHECTRILSSSSKTRV